MFFVSEDGKNYEQKVIFRATQNFWANKDYWAPEVHKIDGKYYLFASFKKDGYKRASHILVSDLPDGIFVPLEKQLTPADWECLDATYYEENGKRYTIFCHEWVQCHDGEMILWELDDRFSLCGEPQKLFSASQAPWVRSIGSENYVTDGPFIYKMKNGELLMLWSSYRECGYAMGMATADCIRGPWTHAEKPLISENGGHGMLFEKDGRLFLIFHQPNNPRGAERAKIVEVFEKDGYLAVLQP